MKTKPNHFRQCSLLLRQQRRIRGKGLGVVLETGVREGHSRQVLVGQMGNVCRKNISDRASCLCKSPGQVGTCIMGEKKKPAMARAQ